MTDTVSEILGGKTKFPAQATPPSPRKVEPEPLPDPEDALLKKKKQKAALTQVTSGRASTILSEAANRARETLG